MSDLNKHTHNHALYAVRLVLRVAGGVIAALLLPSMVGADSRVQTGAPSAPLRATAHVNFKIIIPKVLYLQVGNENDRAVGAETVAIMSNSHNVTLNATVRTPDSPAHGNVILSAAARKVIAQDAPCALGLSRAAAAPEEARGAGKVSTHQVVCTVSMP